MTIRISTIISILVITLLAVVAAGPSVFAQFRDWPTADDSSDPVPFTIAEDGAAFDPFGGDQFSEATDDSDPFAGATHGSNLGVTIDDLDPFADSDADRSRGRPQPESAVVDAFGNAHKPKTANEDELRSSRMRIRQKARVIVQEIAEPISAEDLAKAKKARSLKARIKKEKNEEAREKLAAELRTLLEDIFDADLQQRDTELTKLEVRVNRLRAALDRRKVTRDRIISLQIETVLLDATGLAFPDIGGEFTDGVSNGPYPATSPSLRTPEVKAVKHMPDGSHAVQLRYSTMVPEQRTRENLETVIVESVRTRVEDGKEKTYTVKVPEQRTNAVTYTVMVPRPIKDVVVTVPKGRDITEFMRDYLSQRRFPISPRFQMSLQDALPTTASSNQPHEGH